LFTRHIPDCAKSLSENPGHSQTSPHQCQSAFSIQYNFLICFGGLENGDALFERFGFDHSCEIMNFILDRDCGFIQEYVAFLYEQKINEGIFLSKFDNHKDMKILWARDDYVSIFSKIVGSQIGQRLRIPTFGIY